MLAKGGLQSDNQLIEIVHEDLGRKLEAFVSKEFYLHSSAFTIKQHKNARDLAESGRSGSIFFVKNRLDMNLAVLKIFYTDRAGERDDYRQELANLRALDREHFDYFHHTKLLHTKQLAVGKKRVAIIAESIAPGKSLNSLIKELGKTSQFSKKHQMRYMDLEETFRKTAVALAELHKKRSFKQPAEGVAEYYQNLASRYGNHTLKTLTGPFGFIHGDCHQGNIFYSALQDRVTFIDFAYAECKKAGAPVAGDVGRFLASFDMLASFYGLNLGEVTSLKKSFIKAYREAYPDVSEESIEQFYRLNLMEFHEAFKKKNTHHNKQAKHIYAFTDEKLKALSMPPS